MAGLCPRRSKCSSSGMERPTDNHQIQHGQCLCCNHFLLPWVILPTRFYQAFCTYYNTCSIVIAVSPFVQRYIALLPPHFQSRIVKWKGADHVFYSDKIYIDNEGPYCHLKNPHNERMSTFYQPSLLQHVRTAFIENKPRITNNENKNILVIKRTKGRRSYSGHDLLLIQLDTVSKHVRIFESNSTLEDHIQLFDRANVVIGPQWAGFSNLVFCMPKHSLLQQDGMVQSQ